MKRILYVLRDCCQMDEKYESNGRSSNKSPNTQKDGYGMMHSVEEKNKQTKQLQA